MGFSKFLVFLMAIVQPVAHDVKFFDVKLISLSVVYSLQTLISEKKSETFSYKEYTEICASLIFIIKRKDFYRKFGGSAYSLSASHATQSLRLKFGLQTPIGMPNFTLV